MSDGGRGPEALTWGSPGRRVGVAVEGGMCVLLVVISGGMLVLSQTLGSPAARQTRRQLKKFLIAMAGSLVILLGILMLVFPGPGWVMIGVGFAILATEFAWARRILQRGKQIGLYLIRRFFPWVQRVPGIGPLVKRSMRRYDQTTDLPPAQAGEQHGGRGNE